MLNDKNFNFRPVKSQKHYKAKKITYAAIKLKVFSGLDHLNKEGRVAAWLIMLNINIDA